MQGLVDAPICSEVTRLQMSLGRAVCAGTDSWLHCTDQGALGAECGSVPVPRPVCWGLQGESLCWPQPLQTSPWQGWHWVCGHLGVGADS